ncbi:MAG: zinc-binding dehydrogenase [Deltaproteobacteria bacterium]|nr:zinc-binding dehydrogenase [Deltaproteobacteria bacterium]
MKALVKYAAGEGNMEIRDIPEPSPGEKEVKIKVMAAGICGSDKHIYHGDIAIPMNPPFVVGHELSGLVAETGPGVTQCGVGDRVTAENSHTVCGHCRYCRSGNYNLCPDRLATGYAFDGAFAAYCVVPESRVHNLPDNVDFHTGALSDPSACVYHAVQELTGVRAGDVVLVTGPGPMGLFSVQYAKANGAVVIITGTSADKSRLAMARQLGADLSITVDSEDVGERIASVTGSREVDVCLECSGNASAARMGLELLRKQGKYTQIGIFGKPVSIDLDLLVYKEIQATGSFSQKYSAWKEAIRLASLGKIKVKPLISHVLPLDAWEDGFRMFESGEAVKVVFDPL